MRVGQGGGVAMRAARAAAVVVVLTMVWMPLSARASDDGIVLFEKFIDEHPKVEMRFSQTTINEEGSELESINGQLWFEIPNLFRLQYDEPALPQIISDGSGIWFYESDIAQAVRHPLNDVGQFGLLAIFSGGGLEALQKSHVLSTGQGRQWRWLIAESKNESQNIRKIRLGWRAVEAGGFRLQQVFVHDAFGGQVRIDIASIGEPSDDVQRYAWTPPAGTDVIDLAEEQ